MRLIDADALIQRIKYDNKDEIWWEIYHSPTIEAELVVKCKDCIHSYGTRTYCRLDHWVNQDGTSFCSYGEKKDEIN